MDWSDQLDEIVSSGFNCHELMEYMQIIRKECVLELMIIIIIGRNFA